MKRVGIRARSSIRIAGVDEAGRGPLAGPVVVAAAILDPLQRIRGLDDSKRLSAARREALEPEIQSRALAWSIAVIEVWQIDSINILEATLLGMQRALEALEIAPVLALIDGNRLPRHLPCRGEPIIGGDALEPAISAASILAKVHRDRLMCAFDVLHPGYGFAQHKGYACPEHLAALRRLGPCAIHRRTYAPVRACETRDLFEAWS